MENITESLIVNKIKIQDSNICNQLKIKPITMLQLTVDEDTERLIVTLDDYNFTICEGLLIDKNYKQILNLIKKNRLLLIEHWSVDPDFDGKTFRSKWEYKKSNSCKYATDNDFMTEAELIIPKKQDKRIVCVKAIDIFGFESKVIQEVK